MAVRVLFLFCPSSFCGIVIIELHYRNEYHRPNCSCNTSQCGFVPAEYSNENFQAIKQAVGNGVIVVEAAGNGSVNLDHGYFNGKFNRNNRDSGAILVGASRSTSRIPACYTNYGSRIDAHGWGENVMTLGYGSAFSGGGSASNENRYYTAGFSGTSSATPIVAGAATSIQGILHSHNKPLLNSLEMRAVLNATGTAQTGGLTKNIGSLPNIIKAVENKGVMVDDDILLLIIPLL